MYSVVLRVVSDAGDVCSRSDPLPLDNSNTDRHRNADFVGLSCIHRLCPRRLLSHSGSRQSDSAGRQSDSAGRQSKTQVSELTKIKRA